MKVEDTWSVRQLNTLRREYGSTRDINVLAAKTGKTRCMLVKKARELGLDEITPEKTEQVTPVTFTKVLPAKIYERIPPKSLKELDREIASIEEKLLLLPDMRAWRIAIDRYNYLCMEREKLINKPKK
ncbi:MAG: hypothetical protein LBR26_13135 [Prevotella sp.]|jgi:hypothetical protein|nr:hypothetical protein [Prevotella sp.]